MGIIVNCSPQDCYKNFGNKEGTLRNSELINKKYLDEDDINEFKKQIIISYNANSNIFFLNDNITKIQSHFRGFKQRKEIKSKLFEQRLMLSQRLELISKGSINNTNNNNNLLEIENNEEKNLNISNIEKNSKSIIKDNPPLIISPKTFFSVKSNDSIEKKILPDQTIENEIYGYFLIKKSKSLKYKGEKDKFTHKKNGFGIVEWDDKSKLTGNFLNNKITGLCKFFNREKEGIFMGEYKENFPNGYGYYKTSKLKIEGNWNKNYINGLGIEIKSDETYYQGEFSNNKKNGIGIYKWSDGTIYEGEFLNNIMNGYGIINYNDGRIYEGQILNGFMNGFGIFKWQNGDIYIGEYVKDVKCGFGIFIWNKNPLIAYAGFWDKGKQNGVGIKINGNVLKFGIWKDGKKETWLNSNEIGNFLTKEQEKYKKLLGKNIIIFMDNMQYD